MLGGWKRGGRGADFSDDLLRRIHVQVGHLGEALRGRLMRREEPRQFAVQLSDVVFDHAQFVECQPVAVTVFQSRPACVRAPDESAAHLCSCIARPDAAGTCEAGPLV